MVLLDKFRQDKNCFKNQKGISLVEVLVVMAIFLTLVSFISLNMFNIREKASIGTAIQTLLSDIKAQQTKAMVGDSNGTASPDNYGIYFESTRYTLFQGSTYSAIDPKNFVVNLDTNTRFTNLTFPGNSLVFLRPSGDVLGFVLSQDSVTIENIKTQEAKTIKLNRYGAIISLQ